MALIENWYPPSRENYETLLFWWSFFPLVSRAPPPPPPPKHVLTQQSHQPQGASLQWAISWYGMGKTSVHSRFNLPGRLAWFTMECPGFLTLLYTMATLGTDDLPWQNKVLAGLYVLHYLYRAVAFPFLQPAMAPIHLLVWLAAAAFQLCNALCLGAWLAAYGPVTPAAWAAQLAPGGLPQFVLGLALFYLGLTTNYYHDEELREIRRREQQRQQARLAAAGPRGKPTTTSVSKHYQVPEAGLFRYVLYPHYLAEWVEWLGFYVACGFACRPALLFLVNEVTSMLPRAVKGRQWYVERFGEEKIRKKWAVIPGVW